MKLRLYSFILIAQLLAFFHCSKPNDPYHNFKYAEIEILNNLDEKTFATGENFEIAINVTIPYLFEYLEFSYGTIKDSSIDFDNATIKDNDTVFLPEIVAFNETSYFTIVGLLKDETYIFDSVEIVIENPEEKYSLIYKSADHDSGTVPKDAQAYSVGYTVTVSGNVGNLQKSGHTFNGWIRSLGDEDAKVYYGGDTLIIGEEDTELHAHWSRDTHTVTFYPQNGEREFTETVSWGTVLQFPEPPAFEGYNFGGWYIDSAGTEQWVQDDTITGDFSLYATWISEENTVMFYSNDETARSTYQKILFGETEELTPNSFTREGYYFRGWAYDPDDNQATYEDEQEYTMSVRGVQLFAVWGEDTNTIVFHSNDGKSLKRHQSAVTNEEIILERNVFERTGYTVTGWSLKADSDSIVFTDTQKITMTAGDLDLYAVWKANSYTVSFHKNDASSTVTTLDAVTAEQVELYASFENPGFKLSGWVLDPNSTDIEYQQGELVEMWPRDIDLYAVWTPEIYSIYFDKSSSTATGSMKPQEIPYGEIRALTKNSYSKANWTFYGWSTMEDGSGDFFGDEDEFEMGVGSVTLYAVWRSNPVMVACGEKHSVLLFSDGSLWAAGSNEFGQLGTGADANLLTFTNVKNDVKYVAAGSNHTMVITNDGRLWAAGANHSGQLGTETTDPESRFVEVEQDIKHVAAGRGYTLAVKNNGRVLATGSNDAGQLGIGDAYNDSSFTEIQGISDAVYVSVFVSHSMILTSEGKLWATGRNAMGQLGLGDSSSVTTPLLAATNVASVSCGLVHTLALDINGQVKGAGRNTYGELADGSSGYSVFTELNGISDITTIAAGQSHSIFLQSDGTLLASGYNNRGELGTGDTDRREIPVTVATDVTYVDTYGGSSRSGLHSYTMIIKNDGTLWATGINFGQYGNGDMSSSREFIQIPLDFYDPLEG
ncbi:InlB B-repeat-containing protein [Chitinispirillales bacterium ANBcel5]|uniref:RCC1 domain-containing protein n=1 Tax=Cellulosispirillum alkaliphilum TaxID=3039283 RepID=UPI002A5606B4|nr:InlB B-repeat-containing protein [Chitinispirillales bacterium ANBcel5]